MYIIIIIITIIIIMEAVSTNPDSKARQSTVRSWQLQTNSPTSPVGKIMEKTILKRLLHYCVKKMI